MSILLVRHGETEWSRSGRHTSRTDLPLVPAGRERATALAAVLAGRDFSLVLSSPLRRARETCELAGLGAAMQPDEDLREWNYGDFEGLTTPEIRERMPNWNLWTDGCPGGEDAAQVSARADRVLARLDAAGGDAVAFAHGHVLRVLGARWMGAPAAFGGRLLLSTGSLSALARERDTQVIGEWNRT